MRVQDGIEVVTPEIAQAYRQAESLVFPSSVRTIESFCFRQFHNLTTLVKRGWRQLVLAPFRDAMPCVPSAFRNRFMSLAKAVHFETAPIL